MRRNRKEDWMIISDRRPKTGLARASRTSRRPNSHRWLWLMLLFAAGIAALAFILPQDQQPAKQAGSNPAATPTAESSCLSAAPPQPLTLAHNRIEWTAALQALTADYLQQTGQEVNVITIRGQDDLNGTLQAMDQAGNLPDLFLIDGPDQFSVWQDRLADLSADPWTKQTTVAFIDDQGYVRGFPTDLQATGLIANLQLLNQAGIDPAGLTSLAAWQTALQALERQKQKLGIDAALALSMAGDKGMAWTNGQTLFNIYLSSGLGYTNHQLVDLLKNGQIETTRLQEVADYLVLLFQASQPDLLRSGTYADQLQAFLEGKAAMIQDSSDLSATIARAGVSFPCAFVPYGAFLPETRGLFAGPTGWFAVNSSSERELPARQFLTALATNQPALQALAEPRGLIPAIPGKAPDTSLPVLAANVQSWSESGRLYALNHLLLPEGLGEAKLGPLLSDLAQGQISSRQFTEQVTALVQSLQP